MSKRQEWLSLDGGAEGKQMIEIERAKPRGTCVRLYGTDDGRPNLPRSQNGEEPTLR